MLRYILTVLLLLAASPALAQQEMRSSTKGASRPLPITGSSIDADHNALDVKCLSGCAGGGGGGTSATDDAAFIPGTGAVTPAGFMFDDVALDSVHEGDVGVGRMSANRNQYTTIRDAAGNERGLNIDANGELGVSAIRSALPAGTNAIGKLSANSGVDIGDVDVTSVTPGTTASALGKAEDAAHASGDVGVMSLCVRAASATDRSAGATDGDYEPCAVDANGKLWTNADTEMPAAATLADDTANPTVPGVASFNMCFDGTNWDRCTKATAGQGAVDTATQRVTLAQGSTACPNYVAISQTADTTLVSGTSSQHFYICSIILVAGAAEVVSLWEGTGTACGTGSTAILGSTTEANGLSISANGGFSAVSGTPFLRTATTANDICLRQSGANRVSGVITYYKAP